MLIKRKSNEGGFALPMVVMCGLVITVVGGTLLLKSMNMKNDSESAAQKSNSMALAEAGIARGLNQLTGSFKKELIPIGLFCGTETDPVTVPSGDGTSVLYRYNSDSKKGFLDSTGRYKNSASRVEVSFPVNETGDVDMSRVPGLWARSVTGSGRIHGNVNFSRVSDCNSVPNPDLSRLPVQSPSLTLPNGNRDPELTDLEGVVLGRRNLEPLPSFSVPSRSTRVCEERSSSVTITADGSYEVMSRDCEVTVRPGSIVNLYRNGDINLRGNNLSGSGSASVTWHINGDIDLYGGSNLGSHGTTIYVYGRRTIDIRGASDIYALLIAPESTVNFVGTAKVGGAVWADTVNLGGGSQGKVYQNLSQSQLESIPSGLVSIPRSPRIGGLDSFTQLEVGL